MQVKASNTVSQIPTFPGKYTAYSWLAVWPPASVRSLEITSTMRALDVDTTSPGKRLASFIHSRCWKPVLFFVAECLSTALVKAGPTRHRNRPMGKFKMTLLVKRPEHLALLSKGYQKANSAFDRLMLIKTWLPYWGHRQCSLQKRGTWFAPVQPITETHTVRKKLRPIY